MNTKELTIKPMLGVFHVHAPDGRERICENADRVGEAMESALWPALKPALEAKKPIKITIEYE